VNCHGGGAISKPERALAVQVTPITKNSRWVKETGGCWQNLRRKIKIKSCEILKQERTT